MCVSLYPAELSATRLMGNVVTINGEMRHVIAYQNVAQNLHPGANAMVLPIPTDDDVDESNFLDTVHAPHILEDMIAATTPPMSRGFSDSRGVSFDLNPSMRVFDHGVYTIATSRNVTKDGLEEALTRVPQHRRPELNWNVLGDYPELYPGQQLAFFCFNKQEAAQSTPLVYHYRPSNPYELFLPALDAHDGNRPQPGRLVPVDHDIIIGLAGGPTVYYQDKLGALAPYLPKTVMRANLSGTQLPNGDFLVSTADIASGGYNTAVKVRRTNSSHIFHPSSEVYA